MKIAITCYATASFGYLLLKQAPMIVAAIRYARLDPKDFIWILACDRSKEIAESSRRVLQLYTSVGMTTKLLPLDVGDNGSGKHNQNSNLVIAKLQEAAWNEAKMQGVDYIWSVEADILPQANTLRCLLDALQWDNQWYDIAMATYPNDDFLGGYGSPVQWIAPSTYPDERLLPAALAKKIEARERARERLASKNRPPSEEQIMAWQQLDIEVAKCPPRSNIFGLQASGWRPRGWISSAYPGIGLGALLPTAYVGLGCTLLSPRAFNLANWVGFQGKSTQDLWLCWRVWSAHGIRMAVTTHAVCSHQKIRDGKMTLLQAYHQVGGPTHGHLRVQRILVDENNDPIPPPPPSAGKLEEEEEDKDTPEEAKNDGK